MNENAKYEYLSYNNKKCYFSKIQNTISQQSNEESITKPYNNIKKNKLTSFCLKLTNICLSSPFSIHDRSFLLIENNNRSTFFSSPVRLKIRLGVVNDRGSKI